MISGIFIEGGNKIALRIGGICARKNMAVLVQKQ